MARSFPYTATVVALLAASVAAVRPAAQTTDPARTNSDETLKDRIMFRLDTDATLKKYDLRVDVADGVATIRGDVATTPQKARAARVATIAGVSKVMIDILVDKDVDRTLAERSKAGLSKKGEHITDAWIAAKVRWLLDREELLKGSDVHVESSDHVVTLAGRVPSAAASARAAQLARGTDGVVRVVNQLMID